MTAMQHMSPVEEALGGVRRAAAWLEEISGRLADEQLPFTRERAKTVLTAFTAVDEARVRYNRALAASGLLEND